MIAQRVRVGALCAIVVSVLVGSMPSQAAPTVLPTDNATARDKHGDPLPPNPLVQANDVIVVTAEGFSPGERVEIRDGSGRWRVVSATLDGRLTRQFVISPFAVDGQHEFVFLGLGGAETFGRHGATAGNVVALVPRHAIVPYRVGDSDFVSPPTPPSVTTPAPPNAPPNAPHEMPLTGVAIASTLISAVAAVGAGWGLARAARRRRRTTQI